MCAQAQKTEAAAPHGRSFSWRRSDPWSISRRPRAVLVRAYDVGFFIELDIDLTLSKNVDSGSARLGLVIARHIAQPHAGTLEFVLAPEAGAAFELTIPLAG